MTAKTLILKQLCFTGPAKPPATVVFREGLNVVYGASDTGKSFILEAVDFMLGGQSALRDIPERAGYDRLALSVAATGGKEFTFFRATGGGQFQVFDGIHEVPPVDVEPRVLGARHAADNPNTVSTYLLDFIGLGDRRVRVNKKNETNSLSFRNLSHLCLVNEGDIQKQGSPIEGGQATQRTRELAVFKLLLTGMDDSAVVAFTDATVSQSSAAKLEFVEELLATYRSRLQDRDVPDQELRDQVARLESSIGSDLSTLNLAESEYHKLFDRRTSLRKRLEGGGDRRTEIDELLARFKLLDEHYQSDLERLEAIREAGTLVAALAPTQCPLCGATQEHQQLATDCDGNVDAVVAAASAELAKITQLRAELADTVNQLHGEAKSFDRLLPRLRDEIGKLDEDIKSKTPELQQLRTRYADLIEKRSAVRFELSQREQIADLQARRDALDDNFDGVAPVPNASTELPSMTLDRFSQTVQSILEAWRFPECDRVHFEEVTRDLVIAGKRRGSRGKGMRAITHAAFTVGLLEYCRKEDQPHPGFVILDSPLLAYREPEGTEDDLRGTDVNEHFYKYLAAFADRQVIIIENVDPPASIAERDTTVFFSKNPQMGRYGLFL